jgi:hypothetical protein
MLADRIAEGGAEMRIVAGVGAVMAALALAGCGGPAEQEQEKEPMKVEDTSFAPLVTAPERVQDRANAAVDLHRGNLDKRLEADEGAQPDEQHAD